MLLKESQLGPQEKSADKSVRRSVRPRVPDGLAITPLFGKIAADAADTENYIPDNGIVERLQANLDLWLEEFNRNRPHQGRRCFGKTPMETFLDAKPIAEEKMIAA